MKIFFIGFNKTGTMTYGQLFRDYNSKHNDYWPKISREANNKQFKRYFDKHDCYSDGELCDFKRLDKAYPNSLFVLNTRSLYDWIYSRIKHIYRDHPIKADGNMAREWHKYKDKTEIIEIWIKRRNAFYKKATEYFENRDNFLILDLNDPNLIEKLKQKTGYKLKKMPKVNVRNEIRHKDKKYWNNIIMKTFEKLNIENHHEIGILENL